MENNVVENGVSERVIPSAVGDVYAPSTKIPFDMNFNFSSDMPVQINSNNQGYGVSTTETGIQEKPSFMRTAEAEAYEFNSPAELAHAAYGDFKRIDPLQDTPPADWKPTSDPSLFYGVRPQYINGMLQARGPKELQLMRDNALAEQDHDDALANGSMFARLIGGLAGAAADPVNLIPIAGWVKYAKFAPTMIESAARALPGIATTSIIQSGARQLDRVNGNLQDFVIDSGVNTAFGTVLFGGLGAGALALDHMELWNLKGISSFTAKGGDFKFNLNDKGEVEGIRAFDATGDLSAAEVSYAQDLANSAFSKSGVFKIPYVGAGILNLKTLPYVGSPLLQMLTSTSKVMNGVADRVADHFITTKGVAEGGTAPIKFESLMKRTYASLRSLHTQVNALHLVRNGWDITNRPVGSIVEMGQAAYSKTLKALGQDIDKNGFTSRDQFHDEIQYVLYTQEPSEHAAVNAAASLYRKKIDDTYKAYRQAYNLPEDWLPPKTATGYLMRVYDTPYLSVNKGQWVTEIGGWLAKADQTIADHMQPINDLKDQIKTHETNHAELIRQSEVPNPSAEQTASENALKEKIKPLQEQLNKANAKLRTAKKPETKAKHAASINDIEEQMRPHQEALTQLQSEMYPGDIAVKESSDKLDQMRKQLRYETESLQNRLRIDPDLQLHVEDWNALSANEAKELESIKAPLEKAKQAVDEQQKVVSELKTIRARKKTAANKAKTVETAQKHAEVQDVTQEQIDAEEAKLSKLKLAHSDAEFDLYTRARNGEINPRLYNTNTFEFKDANDRLRFRDVYPHQQARDAHAEAYWNTILNQTPEDTIAQVMGKLTGNQSENHIKARTLLLPDDVLYRNNFMTKDLPAKVTNYVTYLSRRTALKNVFKDVTHDGGFEPILEKRLEEFQAMRAPLDEHKAELQKQPSTPENEKLIAAIDKQIKGMTAQYNGDLSMLNKVYQKMMGTRQRTQGEQTFRSLVMSITAMTNLHMLPATQIADLGSIGLQHGVWPFVRDAVYPVIESLGGILKTADSEALRKTAPSVDMALQDVLNAYNDKNFAMEAQPYINLGRIVHGVEKLAHFSANTDLTTYIDNGLQRLSGSVIQSEFMRILHAAVDGTMTDKESLYLRKYGIDPEKWGERMVNAYKEAAGYKTKLGGYQSKFWEWQDHEAANAFGDAVFKGIQNTILTKGMLDSPFWADNMLGMIFHTFTGWGYASINRMVVPALQHPDAEKLLGVMLSVGFGALVSPLRRIIRGENPYPDNYTDKQKAWEAINDSNATSAIANVLSWANLISDDRLLGDLKNDKYRDRMRSGALGPVWGTSNRMADIISALSTGEMNQQDAKQMARMLPIFGSVWGYNMSQKLIDNLGLPPTRAAAKAQSS